MGSELVLQEAAIDRARARLPQRDRVSPTILRIGSLRFFFFSREEARVHVHIQAPDGEAKFWLDPEITLADQVGLRPAALKRIERLVRKHELEIRKAWKLHFRR